MPMTRTGQKAAEYAEVATVGIGFITEFPVVLAILLALIIFGGAVGFLGLTTAYAGFFALINIVFGIFLVALILLRNKWVFPVAPMTGAIIFGFLYFLYNAYLLYSNCINAGGFLSNIWCPVSNTALLLPNLIFYFIPAFLVGGAVLWINRLI